MNNNDIFKKLRVALMLRDDQIVEILELVDFRMSKGEIGNIFRSESHESYMECGDQVLRNFLNGLVIHLRGTKDNPKNPNDVLAKHRSEIPVKPNQEAKVFAPKSFVKNTKPDFKKKSNPTSKSKDAKNAPKIQVVEKVRYSNGKNKS